MSLLAVASSSWKESMTNKGDEGDLSPQVTTHSNRPPLSLGGAIQALPCGINLPYSLHTSQYSLDVLLVKGGLVA